MRLTAPTFARFALALASACLVATAADAAEKIGVVLLHGGGSDGSQFNDMRPVIEKAGYGLETPDMCWSASRRYRRTAEECLEDTDKAVAKLKARGFERIVIAGHSMGGINAILYAANRANLAGLIVFAPSSPPRGDGRVPNVAIARELVKRGLGDEVTAFQGGINDIMATPRAYLSYTGQESPLYDYELLPKITTPILWVRGTMDAGQVTATERFKFAPAHPLNAFMTVNGDHFDTPDVAAGEMVQWLDRLAAAPAM